MMNHINKNNAAAAAAGSESDLGNCVVQAAESNMAWCKNGFN